MFIILQTIEEVTEYIEKTSGYLFIYKHSATCPTAILAKHEIEKVFEIFPDQPILYVHVRDNRELSNEIEKHFGITHESPQLLTFKNGKIKDIKNHHSITSDFILHTLNGGYNNKTI